MIPSKVFKTLKNYEMKTLLKLLFTVACISLFASCEKEEEPFKNDVELKSAEVFITVPFKADFIGEYVNFIPGPVAGCDEDFAVQVFVDFIGNATHLGKMHGSFKFCAGGPDDPDIEGEDSKYAPSESFMVAANGDSLFVSISGSVRQNRTEEHPEYVTSWWRDEFIIDGGTGRFKGATGGGWSDDYNSSLDPNSHHHWKGTITMMKGGKK